jgi:hypothetical protein
MSDNEKIYETFDAVPVKILMPDGKVLSFTGEVILPADAERAHIYAVSNFVASKWLMPDGSVVSGIPVNIASSDITVDTTNFTKNLTSADDTVQKALETVDQLTGSGSYTLPKASATVLGGIKIGDRLSIDGNGVVSADIQTIDIATEVHDSSEKSDIGDTDEFAVIDTESSPPDVLVKTTFFCD